MESKAISEIKSDAIRLIEVKILAAIESEAWTSVFMLADRLKELAANGMHHASKAKIASTNQFAIHGK